MTVSNEGPELESFSGFESLKDSLLYGVKSEDLILRTDELIRTGLYLKAAGFRKTPNPEILNIPQQRIWPEAHFFIEAIIETGEKNLIYEWCQILKSKSGCLPVNALHSLLNWSVRDLEMAPYVIPVLGHTGTVLAGLIPEWHILSATHCKHPLKFEKIDFRLVSFKQFRLAEPDLAFRYFIENHHHLKENEKLKWLQLLKYKMNRSEVLELISLFDSSKLAMQIELVQLSLCDQESDYYQQCRSMLLKCLSENSMDAFQFSPLGKKEYQWTNDHKIKCLPLAFFENDIESLQYIEWIESQGEHESLIESVRQNPSAVFLNAYFNYLLNANQLTEDFPTAILSLGMDYTTFNKSCIKWIEHAGDKLDLEAFLHFINLEKHFWSDELLAKILELRLNKALDKKYDFTIFWQLLPVKINPNSIHIKSIPAECKIFNSSLVNFDSMIQFRKWIRK